MITFVDENSNKINLDDDDQPIKYSKLSNGLEISVKNIGKQIKWDYVFYIEYLGPIIIIPIFYFLGKR